MMAYEKLLKQAEEFKTTELYLAQNSDITLVVSPVEKALLLKENPSLNEEFEQWKRENPDAASVTWYQLNWFFSKSPYWDERKNIYPVGRILPP